jgi:uncharacterized protein (DUF983 family)
MAALTAGLKGQCPRCGERTLFAGLVAFAPSCRACGLDLAAFNVGDGPAAFLIPVGAALTIGGLRLAKALLIAREYETGAGA